MATLSKRAKGATSKKAPDAGLDRQEFKIRPNFEPTEDTPTYYANHFEVGQTPHEFFILAGRIPGKISSARRMDIDPDGTMNVDPEVQILLAPSLVPGLIKALTSQLEKWKTLQATQTLIGEIQ